MTKAKHPTKWKWQVIHEKDLDGYVTIPKTEDLYRISTKGQCVSRRHPGCHSWPGWWIQMKIIKSRVDRPYNRIVVYIEGEKRLLQVGRLVLQCFVGDPPTSEHIACHLNGVSDDDRLENLKWGLPVDVSTGKIIRGTYSHGDKSPHCSFAPEQVRAIRRILNAGISQSTLANAVGVPQTRIREIAKGITRNPEKHIGRENPLTGEVVR